MELLPDSEDKNMENEEKSTDRFINELAEMNRRTAELGKLETEYKLRIEILQGSDGSAEHNLNLGSVPIYDYLST